MTEGKTGGRLRVLAGVLAFMLAAIVTRLWFLQVMAVTDYQAAAESNHVRKVPIPSPRGRIMDRSGNLLVRNRTSQVVTVRPIDVPNVEQLLLDLSAVLDVPPEELGERLDDPDYGSFQRIPVAVDVKERDILYLAEHKDEFPGVDYGLMGVRDYPHGALAAHVLGYLGQLGPGEPKPFKEHQPGQPVGRGGVEQAYEAWLHGRDGYQFVEVDARGKRIGQLRAEQPVEGYDLVLSVDRRIQRAAENALAEGVEHAKGVYHEDSGKYLKAPAGAVVAMDPRNGEILAMASFPTYDPRVFLEGLTQREWQQLNNPKKNYPLNNRATQGQYPPGSTLKPLVAAAAVKAGYASVNGFYPCPPEFRVKGDTSKTVWRNWKDTDSGVISFGQALIESCDTVFYRFGLDFYRERKIHGELLQRQLRGWGMDRDTGVDLPGEQSGRVPDAQWKSAVHEEEPELFPDPVWYPGDSINMSIGQGDLLTTPLQMARSFAALGNGGILYEPHVGLRVQTADGRVVERVFPKRVGRLPYSNKVLARIRGALQGVVTNGTGAQAFLGFPTSSIPVAGKTGTSEVFDKQPHSWFVAMAPADDPQIVVAAIVEEGGHGSEVAAPIVRRILEHVFDLEVTPFRLGVAS
ncbi:MAG TPA: penicillin-binding protein 2, partial [Actinomycetota bacterium]